MKKLFLFIIAFFGSYSLVSAKEINFYFYPNGGVVGTAGFEQSSYGYLNYNDQFFASYKDSDSISVINSINGVSFTLAKNNSSLVSGREWYSIINGTTYYFSQSKTYQVNYLFDQLDSNEDDFYSIDLYANWTDNQQVGGIDMPTTNKIRKANSISIDASSKKLKIGSTTSLKIDYSPSNSTPEKITWTSSDASIATVNSNGVVKGISKGKVKITATSENGLKSSINIKVVKPAYYVYIKYHINNGTLLKKHGSEISEASGYILKNGSDVIHKIKKGKSMNSDGLANYNNSSYINLERDGYYIKKGEEWKDDKGNVFSQSVKYKSSDFCDNSKSNCTVVLYANWRQELKLLGNIETKNEVILDNSHSDVTSGAQGFTMAKGYYVTCRKNKADTVAAISVYNKNHKLVKSTVVKNKLSHCNDLAYNPNSGNILVPELDHEDNLTRKFTFSGAKEGKIKVSTLKLTNKSGDLVRTSAIAFDPSGNYVYAAKGSKIYVFDEKLNYIRSFRKVQSDTPQGIGAYQGKILVVRYNSDAKESGTVYSTRNAVDIYRNTGEYLGTYIIENSSELEALDWNSNASRFGLFFHNGKLFEVKMKMPK